MTAKVKHDNLMSYALAYASKGFSVIPISDTTKRPLVSFAGRPPLSADEIKRIWSMYPNANIALKTDDFFVFDIDKHGTDGTKSIKALNHDEWFTNTLMEKTAHDGFHFYFTKPHDFHASQIIGILPGVDLKAHPNNYVLCAPSELVEKDDAGNAVIKRYEWLNHLPMRLPSKELLDFIYAKYKEEHPVELKGSYTPTAKTQTTDLFEMIVDGLGFTGGRNNALASFLGGLLYRGVDPVKAAKLAEIANSNTPDPLDNREVERTINSVLRAEVRRREGIA